MKLALVSQVFVLFSAIVACDIWADDTELYVKDATVKNKTRPKILVVLDNSGSMGNKLTARKPYVPSTQIDTHKKVYYSFSSTEIPSPDSKQFFKNNLNGCKSSKYFLKNYGMYTDFFRHYSYIGDNGLWRVLPEGDGVNITIADCYNDIEEAQYYNTTDYPQGLPVNGLGSQTNISPYYLVNSSSNSKIKENALKEALKTGFSTGKPVHLYSEHYVNWYHGNVQNHFIKRIELAKNVIQELIVTTPGVDFGLMIFNRRIDGGRIVLGVKQLDSDGKITFNDVTEDIGARTSTPLCETLYEAMRYLGGKSIKYSSWDTNKTGWPKRDDSIISNGSYISPFEKCERNAYVVYVTDGAPWNDWSANSLVLGLNGVTEADRVKVRTHKDPRREYSYLAALAGWMKNNDLAAGVPGKQTVTTYTIGFSEGANSVKELLQETAKRSGGKYYTALDANALKTSLRDVFSDILEVDTSFTSPSIASNNFDRTRTFDSVYYAMFLPNKGPRWSGNLKKLKVTVDGTIVDKNGTKAINDEGNLAASACTYWTSDIVCQHADSGGDGSDVAIGGAAGMLVDSGWSNRTFYVNSGDNGSLQSLTKQNLINKAGSANQLVNDIGVKQELIDDYLEWFKGRDIFDENENNNNQETRRDIMGDPLHSKPLAINYGSQTSPDIRIVVGTNHGVMHMFKDQGSSISETWAFMPYELVSNIRELKENNQIGLHSVYGLDARPSVHTEYNNDGRLTKAWLFFGMRRGGSSYFALDITKPDEPKFMWKIDTNSAGLEDLGQSWAKPIITRIPGWPANNTEYDSAKPVMIIGGGYDTEKDSLDVVDNDAKGRGVYIIDAKTGALVHSFGHKSNLKMTKLPGITDSIPNTVAVLDSNNDELSDRIYASDTGGNIWRIDMPSTHPKSSQAPWTAYKFAELGAKNVASDIRFYSEPVVAQTMINTVKSVESNGSTVHAYQKIPYDAVVIGSGLRPNPSDSSRQDTMFVLQDRNIITKSAGYDGVPIPQALKMSHLYDVTSAPADHNSAESLAQFSTRRGWYYNFKDKGEKNLSAATILNGKVFFTSYVPEEENANSAICLAGGVGRLYGFNLNYGYRAYTKEHVEVGQRVPDTPQLVIPADSDGNTQMHLIGIGNAAAQLERRKDSEGNYLDDCPETDKLCLGQSLNKQKVYYFQDEIN
ncbi:pilus assembly protein [Shewanella marina]|uniref:pilus assembly protein n=1 Tax=Shewanella marina TaxID=487319 RepID=UPI0004709108|nr:PilC/PilY family type IV pilus protein [Shewanella marina]